jgi:hypothetical protein
LLKSSSYGKLDSSKSKRYLNFKAQYAISAKGTALKLEDVVRMKMDCGVTGDR